MTPAGHPEEGGAQPLRMTARVAYCESCLPDPAFFPLGNGFVS